MRHPGVWKLCGCEKIQSPNNLGIVAFLDGTLLKTCRPRLPPGVTTNALQRAQYNGHKKHHGFKFQHVLAPNDIIIGAYGPLDGRRLDAFMLLAPLLPQMADNTITTYRLLQSEEASNRVMSSCRVSVEWGFNLVTNTFQTVDFTRWNRRWMPSSSVPSSDSFPTTSRHLLIAELVLSVIPADAK